MHFTTVIFTLLGAFASAQGASNSNPIVPLTNLQAGQPYTIAWTPTTKGTISLQLRSGQSLDLKAGPVIASSIPNSGSYTWTPSTDLKAGTDYSVAITDDSNPKDTNYSPYFGIISNGKGIETTTGTTTTTGSSTTQTSTTTGTTSASASSNSTTTSRSSTTSASKTASDVPHNTKNAATTFGAGVAVAVGAGAVIAGLI